VATLELDITCRLRAFAVELSLAAGEEVVALAGPSGAGKTTVLRCVAGLRRPDLGRIACGGETWFEHGRIEVPAERRSVGYVPQHHALFPHLTVERNVAFSGASAGEVAALLERLGIAHLARELPASLSGGERQRVALARALARRPRVLLLDEPLAALDAHTRRLVRDELARDLRSTGVPTLLVTHDFADAAALAGRVAVVDRGVLRQLGTPAELVAAPADAFVVVFTGGSVLAGEADGAVVLPGRRRSCADRRAGAGPRGGRRPSLGRRGPARAGARRCAARDRRGRRRGGRARPRPRRALGR
jgi:molybdate transport system ATP-binding protein